MHGFSFQFFKVYILSLHTQKGSVVSRRSLMKYGFRLIKINFSWYNSSDQRVELVKLFMDLRFTIVQILDVQTTYGE